MRALRVLREVDLIAAEDTRRTARLLQHYSIVTPTTSLHEHNEHGKAPHLVARLQSGTSIALVSDAGMPLISDPGALLVREARSAGIRVEVVPGPSAVTAALAGIGHAGSFTFLGFPPAAGADRRQWMATVGLLTAETAIVFFEAPHRITRTLTELLSLLGNKPINVGRELTKVHESLVEKPINAWLEHPSPEKGEFVVVIPQGQTSADIVANAVGIPDDASICAEFGALT
nr:16S rRNA (cytidine(1402)-2'-O)-methyltransferase [Acidobacteriota bacterium]